MTNEQLLEVLQPLLETELKYRDFVEFGNELGFDTSESNYDNFCAYVDEVSK